MSIKDLTVVEAANLSLGRVGSVFVNDSKSRTGEVFAIQILADGTSFDTFESDMEGDVSSFDFAAGTVIYATITSITLAGGACILYRG